MSNNTVIKVENLSKQYRLGTVGTGTLRHDVNRAWHKLRGKEDPYLTLGETNERNVKGSSEYVWALQNINFTVNHGDVLGIIGRNGAGKSTLLKLLSRTTSPSTGSIKIKGRVASLLEVGTGFHGELSGRENIFLNGAIMGMSKQEIKKKLEEIIAFAGVERYIDTPVKRYSSGMYVRLAFGVAAHLEPDILIVDEVLAVGDAEFQKKALGKMKDVSTKEGRTVLFVSHNLIAVKNLCTRSIFLSNGQIHADGLTNEILEKYLKANDKLNYISFQEKPLIDIIIYQDKNTIKIEANYSSAVDLDIPNLGFVIYNSFDTPLFGSNPGIQNYQEDVNRTYNEGKIVVTITNPILVDGEYHASIWFGDSQKNHFEAFDCLYFDVSGMTTTKYLPANAVGNIVPEVKWQFI